MKQLAVFKTRSQAWAAVGGSAVLVAVVLAAFVINLDRPWIYLPVLLITLLPLWAGIASLQALRRSDHR